ncbi:hypothetical protein FRC12_009127 [Ceratobasidium sp. 428]|nr:hypothetical protein FRC12_009127 [Ceratobasidium sp. 428]
MRRATISRRPKTSSTINLRTNPSATALPVNIRTRVKRSVVSGRVLDEIKTHDLLEVKRRVLAEGQEQGSDKNEDPYESSEDDTKSRKKEKRRKEKKRKRKERRVETGEDEAVNGIHELLFTHLVSHPDATPLVCSGEPHSKFIIRQKSVVRGRGGSAKTAARNPAMTRVSQRQDQGG